MLKYLCASYSKIAMAEGKRQIEVRSENEALLNSMNRVSHTDDLAAIESFHGDIPRITERSEEGSAKFGRPQSKWA